MYSCYPCGTDEGRKELHIVLLFPVFLWCHAECVFEYAYKVGAVGESQCKGNVLDRHVGGKEEMLGFLNTFTGNVLHGSGSDAVLEKPYEVLR